MDELLVECSIHLDGVSLKDMRSFKCGHGFCKTCIDTLFAGPPPFKCPTCRKRIQRKDAFQIFLNLHRSLTQPRTQSAPRDSGIDIDPTLSDDPDSTTERVSSLRKKTREYATEIKRLQKRLEQLQHQFLGVSEERDALEDEFLGLQGEYAVLEGQNADLKSTCTTHENERRKADHARTEIQKRYEAAENAAQEWREKWRIAQKDAKKAEEKNKEQDERMKELAERKREFENRAHELKVAVSMHSFQASVASDLSCLPQSERNKIKYTALKEKHAHLLYLQKIEQIAEDPEDQSLLVVDRNAPDRLERAFDKDWLDDVCDVRGDNLDIEIGSDYDNDSGKENGYEGDENQTGPSRSAWLRGGRATESVDDRERPLPEDRPRPAVFFESEWNLERDGTGHNRVSKTKKRKNEEDAVMGARPTKVVKVSLQPAGLAKGKGRAIEERGSAKPLSPSKQMTGFSLTKVPALKSKPDLALNLDSRGHLKGIAMLGSRRRFDKKS
ncbi:uncharacterized protein EDB91DRAFT_1147516 [Suillus paluster]|uniref:uncharacterized protein n=1 Tax=Suillus paluster TaxID=48578 RepID=UPI001B85C903|nr:uncharacterized protein EDB91DRAFT_1147516 [Suillus paluster]KAG1734093.1 hypothetical protein EDB91DRAFT_1147516 [Suillus paluster]